MNNVVKSTYSALVNFIYTRNYQDNCDNKQHYRDMKISVINPSYIKTQGRDEVAGHMTKKSNVCSHKIMTTSMST